MNRMLDFVDSHAEGYGGRHNLYFVSDKIILNFFPVFIRHTCVIGPNLSSPRGKPGFPFFSFFPADAVNYSRFLSMSGENFLQLCIQTGLSDNPVSKIRPIEGAYILTVVSQVELFYDIFPDLECCGCREGAHGTVRKHFPEFFELSVLPAEIVAPHGDTVGFIHSYHGNVYLFCDFRKTGAQGFFWREIEEFYLTPPKGFSGPRCIPPVSWRNRFLPPALPCH